ncbi:carboxylesterase family protein [Mucisphaera calidilacus]|nr:PHB depolymerase family esterase [Mucisphaera calidilacus]
MTMATADVPTSQLTPDRLDVTVERQAELPYLISFPEGYNDDPQRRWPLVLFLHGAGERGDDLERVKSWGPGKRIEEGEHYPAIIVTPQCPADRWWPQMVFELVALIDAMEAEHRIDSERIYLTGLSMGGFGTWALAAEIPERVAAIGPICGGAAWYDARVIGWHQIPVWAFHGDADPVVEVEESLRAVQRLRAAGHENARLTLYSGVGHNSWTETYDNPEFWSWLFAQRLSNRPAPQEDPYH